MRLQPLLVLMLLVAACFGGRASAQGETGEAAFKDWAVGILAADWRAGDGTPIEAFENSRKALAQGFADAGFSPDNIANMSLRPRELGGFSLSSEEVFAAFGKQAAAAPAGCLLYFTSHGNTDGIVLGREGFLSPTRMKSLVGEWCGERPTVVVVSACFSGVFLSELAAPNRMVMTAARPDRSSFGCSPDAQYPYFDGCILESLQAADDFVHLASMSKRCVARRERAEHLWPPSEPLSTVGKDVEDFLIFQNFERAAPPGG
ncbi:C13 family peptidase [Hyphomonas sp.]|jgi:hypothetical protein|uniref:C13 family peptidase n=1 Tax=Hyphomonas sp. TaxID=87 RepID=UPI0025C0CDC9|nr:C13 family peptidase [Hyphomonas sp.]